MPADQQQKSSNCCAFSQERAQENSHSIRKATDIPETKTENMDNSVLSLLMFPLFLSLFRSSCRDNIKEVKHNHSQWEEKNSGHKKTTAFDHEVSK